MNFNAKSLRFRILLTAITGTFVLFALLMGMSVLSSFRAQSDLAQSELSAVGAETAGQVEAQLNDSFQSSKDLATWIVNATKPDSKIDITEQSLATIFYDVLKSRPAIFGIWLELLKSKMDAHSKLKLTRQKASKEYPRYIFYWTKNLKGEISDNASSDGDINADEGYFLAPMKAGHDVATDPYVYPVDGQNVLMTSLTKPVFLNGEFLGVGGVDVDLNSLQKLADSKSIFDGAGQIAILSQTGLIAAYTGKPEQINKTIWKSEELEKWSKEKWVEAGDSFHVVKKIKIGESDAWYVLTTVPRQVVYAPIYKKSLEMVGFSMLTLLLFIGILAWMISGMSSQLTKVTESLGESGVEVSRISSSMSDSASALSSASSEAAASLEETSAAVEELSSTLQVSSENANKAKDLSSECVQSAQLGQKQVENLSKNIGNIETSSKKMEEITGVIDDIAFQTNLLALNAAVEAARAGEHGKGFSVVAEAVRTLAQKCAVSAKEISDLIRANVDQIQEGSKQMQASGESLKNIVSVVEKVNALNSEIASMAKEQALGISDINKAIQQLDTVTQRNAQASEESERAAQALTEQSQNLYNYVQGISSVVLGGTGSDQASNGRKAA